jgi:hypothetical protein
VAEERIGDMTGKMSTLAEGVTAKAGQQWDKLESIFEERVARALKRLGVPAHKDVQALADRIDELSAQVAKLTKAPRTTAAKKAAGAPVKAAKTAKANGAVKPATRRAASRKKAAAAEAPAAE